MPSVENVDTKTTVAKLRLVRSYAGKKWHYYKPGLMNRYGRLIRTDSACSMVDRGNSYQIVRVWSVWEKPVKGNTCIVCQPEITRHIQENLKIFLQSLVG